MADQPAGIRKYLENLRTRLLGSFHRMETSFSPQDPLVAVIRREGAIVHGRYVMYFEVTLFGDNPVVLEEFGHVQNRETDPSPAFRRELAEKIKDYRYFIEIRQRFHTIEEARDFWVSRGATAFWNE